MVLSDSRQAGAIEIEVTPAMIEAGINELYDHSLADGLPYVMEVVFRAMAYESPLLLSKVDQDNQALA